ncbi:MAG TPA: lysophospholipid acyltransferase family protein [Acetobacteraceae bacterium]
MDITPNRLKAKRIPLLRDPDDKADDAAWSGIVMPVQRGLVRKQRAARRAALALGWTLLCMPVQACLLPLPGAPKVLFARLYWAALCRLIGMHVRVIGTVADADVEGRPVVFVSNHSSWLDIPVLGGRLSACFIAKEDVARWPVIRTVARLGRTLYVRRTRAATGRERDDMGARLAGGDNLVLFPEGTTSDGSRVLPFRSAFLSVAELAVTPLGATPIVQPVSVVYDRLAGLPTGRATRPLFAWYGDMEIGSHFWRLAQHQGLGVTVLLHQPIDPAAYASRKALAQATWKIVAEGAATLRQNRPATPIGPAPGASVAQQDGSPAYA